MPPVPLEKKVPCMTLQTTNFIVLRKSPYGESSVVAAGLSESEGRMAFMVRGARRLGRRDYPVVDLFRCLRVRFRSDARSSLQHWSDADGVDDFGALARHSRRYLCAGAVARFLLRETAEAVPLPHTYTALHTGLRRLAEADPGTPEDILLPAVRVGILLTFLHENGELDVDSFLDKDEEQLLRLLRMAAGEERVPRLSPATWHHLDNWTKRLLDTADYRFDSE